MKRDRELLNIDIDLNLNSMYYYRYICITIILILTIIRTRIYHIFQIDHFLCIFFEFKPNNNNNNNNFSLNEMNIILTIRRECLGCMKNI